MATRTVQEDKHGLYVKDNGTIFRPQVNDFYRPMHNHKITTEYKRGDKAKVHGIYDMQYIDVGENERWYSHGSYIAVYKPGDELRFQTRKSEECWQG
jgi:hypothetical protein